jgi:dihydrodipicolinate synthase/N-acetylneuraminate lyase
MNEHRPAPLRGITPIIVTPYDHHDRIVFDDVASQVDHLARLDVAAIGIGFGSDIVRLTDRERDDLVSVAAATVRGRRRILAAVGGNATRAIVDRALLTLRAGADILMVTPPGAVASPTPDAIVDAYVRVGQETGAPIVVQDAPGFTGTAMSPELLVRIAREVPQVVALKIEAVPPAPKVGMIAAADHAGVAVLGGAGGMDFWHELERGADGTVPGSAMAELFLAVQALHAAGDRDAARTLFNRHLPLLVLAARDMDTFFAVQHQLLHTRGITTATRLRTPSAIDPGLATEVSTLMADLAIGPGTWVPRPD